MYLFIFVLVIIFVFVFVFVFVIVFVFIFVLAFIYGGFILTISVNWHTFIAVKKGLYCIYFSFNR